MLFFFFFPLFQNLSYILQIHIIGECLLRSNLSSHSLIDAGQGVDLRLKLKQTVIFFGQLSNLTFPFILKKNVVESVYFAFKDIPISGRPRHKVFIGELNTYISVCEFCQSFFETVMFE